MTVTTIIGNVVWALSIVLQAGVGAIMLRRTLHRRFPVFFAYTIYHVISSIFYAVVFFRFPGVAFEVYWGTEGIDALFTLAVIQEIFTVMFDPYDALRRFGIVIFRWLAIVLCVFAVATAVMSPSGEINPTTNAVFLLDRSVQIVELGLVIFLFVFCRLFGMTWRHYTFGIAAGLLAAASSGMAVLALRTHQGQSGNSWFNLAAPIGYTLGIVMWTYYFASEKSVVPLNIVPRTDQLIAWNQALSRVGQR